MDAQNAERIHEASLRLLRAPGVRVEHDEVRALLLANGARAGSGPADVIIPEQMVDDCLAACPSSFALADRRGGHIVLSPECKPVIWSCPGLFLFSGGEHRPFTSADMARTARLMDRLENVDGVFGMALDDVPPAARDVVGLNVIAHNTAKHVRVLCFTPRGADLLVEMKRVAGPGAWFSIGFTAHGPLRWTRLALEIFRRTAGHGIPVSVNGEPMAGVSGPVTLAGAAAVGNAEILAALVINQLLEPGRPCTYNLGLAHTLDMRTAVAVTGGPENVLFAQLSAALGRFYRLPSASWVSTESMCPDSQAALEKMIGFHAHMAAGVSNIWGVGQLESQMTISAAQAVIDDEMIAYVRRYLRGVEVTDETLAVGLSQEVGIAGSFLDHPHTAERYRSELFMPKLLFRQRREDWNVDGRRRLAERAEEVAAELMSAEPDNGLSVQQSAELNRICERFVWEVG